MEERGMVLKCAAAPMRKKKDSAGIGSGIINAFSSIFSSSKSKAMPPEPQMLSRGLNRRSDARMEMCMDSMDMCMEDERVMDSKKSENMKKKRKK